MPNIHDFGTAPDGTAVKRIILERGDLRAQVITWGASLQALYRRGADHSLVLGADDLGSYLGPMRYFGAIVGRVANRIAGGTAVIDGQRYAFDQNERDCTTLHGGRSGTGSCNWVLEGATDSSCTLSLVLRDGQDGFPGALRLTALYELDGQGGVTVSMTGQCDVPTLCNLAHHAYWNLDGAPTTADHLMQVPAKHYLAVDELQIPKGPPQPVQGTRFDFQKPRAINNPDEPILDHNFCFETAQPDAVLCRLSAGGLMMTVHSDQPGLQVYDASGMNTAPQAGLGGIAYGPHAGIAIEPQHWPDAPNRPDFEQVTLLPGETYRQTSRFHFAEGGL